jgi:serine protease Do
VAPLRALVIAHDPPQPGQDVTAAGFPGAIGDVMDPSRLPSPTFASGRVSSQPQVEPGGEPTTQIDAPVSEGMGGGPTVRDETGEVLGVVNGVVSGQTLITDAAQLRTFLKRNDVQLAELPATKSFPWMWVIIGVVAAAVVAALIELLVLSGNRKHRQQARQDHPEQP